MAFSNHFSNVNTYSYDNEQQNEDSLDLMTSSFVPDRDIKYRSLSLSLFSTATEGPTSRFDIMGGMEHFDESTSDLFLQRKDGDSASWAPQSESVPVASALTLASSHFPVVGRLGTPSAFVGQLEDFLASEGMSVERSGPFRLSCQTVVSAGLLKFDLALLESEQEGLVVEFRRMQGDSVAAQHVFMAVKGLFDGNSGLERQSELIGCLDADPIDADTKAMLDELTVELLEDDSNADLQICTLQGLLREAEQPSARVLAAVRALVQSAAEAEVRQMALRVVCKHGDCESREVEVAVRELVRAGQRHLLGGVLAAMEKRADLRADRRLSESVDRVLQVPTAVY